MELAQSAERRFESFAKLATEVLWETDARHRYTSFVAKGTFRMRRKPEFFIGKTRWEAIGADSRDPFWAAHIADLEAHRPLRGFAYQAELGDGTLHWLRLNAEPQFDADGTFTGYRGTTQDVTELRAAEAAAKANERRFQEFANLGSDVLWETDENHVVTYISERPEWKSRRPASAFVGKTRWQIVGADPADPFWAAHIADLDAHRPIRGFEYHWTIDDGSVRYVRVNGQPQFDERGKFLGYRGTTTDMTAARAAEAAARASEERFRQFAGVASDWLWETDVEHRFTYFVGNAGTLDHRPYGVTRWDLVGASLAEPKWRAHFEDLEARRPFRSFEYTRIDAAGRTRQPTGIARSWRRPPRGCGSSTGTRARRS
jgi:PAS domain-containing protein